MFPYAIDDPGPRSRGPVAALILLNLLFFLIDLLSPALEPLAFVPARPRAATWFTSQFLHAGFAHFAGNMYALWLFGPQLAARLGLFFIPFYLTGGLAALFLHRAFAPGSLVPCVGASGAICALIGAYALVFPRSRMRFFSFFAMMRGGLSYTMSAALFGALYVGLQFLGGAGSDSGGGGVAYWAHLGGLLFGACASPLVPASTASERRESDESSGRLAEAAAAGRDEEAASLFAAALARDGAFSLPAGGQLAVAGALLRTGRSALARAALEAAAEADPAGEDGARALLALAELEHSRLRELSCALRQYARALAHPGCGAELRAAGQAGLARARAALLAPPPAPPAGASCLLLHAGPPPLSEEQRAAVDRILDVPVHPRAGFLSLGLPPERALQALASLAGAGVPAALLPAAARLRLGEASALAAAVAGPEGLRDGEGAPRMPWESLLLAAALRARREVKGEVKAGLLDVRVEDGMPDYAVSSVEFLGLELVERDGRRHRWEAPADEAGAAALRGLLASVAEHAPWARLDWGARAALRGEVPESCAFDSFEEAQAYLDWQAQLARLLPPRAAS